MAARCPELWESGLICQQDPQKRREYKEGKRKFPFLKERELDEDQLVPSKAQLCFSSVLLQQGMASGSEGNCAKQIQ